MENKNIKSKKKVNYNKIIIVGIILVIIIAILYFVTFKNIQKNDIENNNNGNNSSTTNEINNEEVVDRIEEDGKLVEEDNKSGELDQDVQNEVREVLEDDIVKDIESKASNDAEKVEE